MSPSRTTLLSLAAMIATTTATPMLLRPFGVPINTVACTVTPWARTEQTFKISILKYFNWGSFCKTVNETLNARVTDGVFGFECFPIDSGASTNLTFVTVRSENARVQVKEALETVYLMVDFEADGWC